MRLVAVKLLRLLVIYFVFFLGHLLYLHRKLQQKLFLVTSMPCFISACECYVSFIVLVEPAFLSFVVFWVLLVLFALFFQKTISSIKEIRNWSFESLVNPPLC